MAHFAAAPPQLNGMASSFQLLAAPLSEAASHECLPWIVAAAVVGVALGWRLSRRFVVPFDADRYFPLTEPDEKTIRGAFDMCQKIRDDTSRCYFKGRLREMVRMQPICDEEEFLKMSKDLHAEIDDCLHFGTCFRYAGPSVSWDISRLPPGPPPLYAGCEMIKDIKRMHRVLCRLSKQYGKVFPMQLEGNPLWVVVSGAKEAKAIFHDNGATTSSRAFGQQHLIAHTDFPAGNFLRCPFSEDLKKRRGVVWREALSKQKVELFRPILEHCRHVSLRAFLRAAEQGEAFLPRPLMRMTYLNVLACILFGINFSDVDDEEYRRVYSFVDDEASEDLAGPADIFPFLRHTPLHSSKVARMKSIRARQDAWLHEKIGARRRHLAGGGEPQTFCDILLATMDSPCPGQRLSYEQVKEICNEIIFAGTDTTATTTETVLAHLLNNPDKAAKLREELDEVTGGQERLPGSADFPRLKYMNACIREAMRLTCAVPFNGHVCTADTEVLGHRIPKGAICINNIYAVHYDPEIYPEPEKFLPERWLDKDPCRWSVENDFEFMPFGVGRRLCLGYNLALENLQLFVASLFSSFDFKSATGLPVSMKEVTEFTVSLPEFKVVAEVRENSAMGATPQRFRELPALKLARLGAPPAAAASEERPAAARAVDGEVAARPRWAVWYASQTGTAEAFARTLALTAEQRGVECCVRSVEKAQGDLRPAGESAAIIIAATYGSGEPTDSAVDFEAQLTKGDIVAEGLGYAVFGLGNSEYEHYNAAARRIDARLAELGGRRLKGVSLGLGDASKDTEGDFEDWLSELLDRHAPDATTAATAAASAPTADAAQVEPRSAVGAAAAWRVRWCGGREGTAAAARPPVGADVVTAVAADVRELAMRPEENGSVVEVALDFTRPGVTYSTADTIAVLPRNDARCVEAMGALLNQPLDAEFMLESRDGADTAELPFPCPTTLREVLALSVDVLGRPTRRAVAQLARLCGDAGEGQRLAHLASPEGRGEWEALSAAGRLSLLEVFQQHPSLADAPLAAFLELVPQMRLKPRHYTASSCPDAVGPGTMGAGRVVLTVKVAAGRVVDCAGAPTAFGGVASSYLAGLPAGDEVRLLVQPSGFAMPADPATPLVMVAAGTGLAPFRGFLQRRRLLLQQGARLGRAVLFFGCARRDADFICEEELAAHVRDGSLSELVMAFSREDPKRKVYVQHRIAEHAAAVSDIVCQGVGHFYVCGSTAMGRAVKGALSEGLVGRGAADRTEAELMVERLEKERRYIAELWA